MSILLVVSLFFLCGWQYIDLSEYLRFSKKESPKIETEFEETMLTLEDFPGFTPYKILQRTTRSFYELKTGIADIEAWMESPFYHLKLDLKQEFQTIDNYKTQGRVSMSVITPNGVSTSNWVQTYQIQGLQWTWDLKKREWEEEELKIFAGDTEVLQYSLLSSLFTINESSPEPLSIKFLGIQQKEERQYFVIQYKLPAEMLKRWDVEGNVSVKAWIDTQTFYPLAMRIEGNISDIYLLQIIKYSEFNSAAEFSFPEIISKRIKEKKEKLVSKIEELVNNVVTIRGYSRTEKINLEFIDRISLLRNVNEKINKEYSKEKLEIEGFVYKWLGLVSHETDYKEALINSQISQIAAYYDPVVKKILVGEWVQPVFSEYVIIHEIVHALQDQFFDLQVFKPETDNWDLSFARQAFIEGEAAAVMLDYLLKKEGREFKDLDDIFSLIEEEVLSQYPYAKENIFYNLYGFGAYFIQSYLRLYSWRELDLVYNAPPSSMKEIIHPEVYIKEEKFRMKDKKKQTPAPSVFLEGWEKRFEVKLGEFFLSIFLRQRLERSLVEKVLIPWQEDRLAVFENENNQKLVFFFTLWYSDSTAADFLKVYIDWLKERYPEIEREDFQGGSLFVTKDKQIFFSRAAGNGVNILWWKDLTIEKAKETIKNISGETDAG